MKSSKNLPEKPAETQEKKIRRMAEIVRTLEQIYPEAVCALEYTGEPWRLMVMARLSAQCTDARVNIVCRELFAEFPTPQALAAATQERVEEIIRPCGLFRTKAESIREECRILCEDYGGVVPDSMEELLRMPGIGRKIANLLLGDIYHRPAIVADTHCICICGRLGMYPTSLKDPHRVEKILCGIVQPEKQSDFCHRIVQFGRDTCIARAPQCRNCPLAHLCPYPEGEGAPKAEKTT